MKKFILLIFILQTYTFSFTLEKDEVRLLSYTAVMGNNYLCEDILDDKAYLMHSYSKTFYPNSKRVQNTEILLRNGIQLKKVKTSLTEKFLAEKIEAIILKRVHNPNFLKDNDLLFFMKMSLSLHKEFLPLSDKLKEIDKILNEKGFSQEFREYLKFYTVKSPKASLPKYLRNRSLSNYIAKTRFGLISFKRVDAFRKSTKWLFNEQNEDGSWGKSNRGVVTSLILKSLYLDPLSQNDENKEKLNKALVYLKKYLKRRSSLLLHGYGDALICQALIEINLFQKDPIVEEVIKKKLELILKSQNKDGGFSENFVVNGNSSLPISSICFETLIWANKLGFSSLKIQKALIEFQRFNKSLNDKNSYSFSKMYSEVKSVYPKDFLNVLGNYNLSLLGKNKGNLKLHENRQSPILANALKIYSNLYTNGVDYQSLKPVWEGYIKSQMKDGSWKLNLDQGYFTILSKDKELISTALVRSILYIDFSYSK